MCEFCKSTDDVQAQDMGEGRVMQLCASCRQNIVDGERQWQARGEAGDE